MPWAVGVQVALVGISNWFLLPYGPLVTAFSLAVVFGTVNGLLEELFWRGAYLEQGGRQSPKLMAVSATLFGVWHLALGSAYGVTYEGGVLALVGGGFALGVF